MSQEKKKSAEDKRAEKENAKRLLLEINLERVFHILAGYATKRSMGETLDDLRIRLKQLRSQLGSERGVVFGHVGPVLTQEEVKIEVERFEAREDRTKKELANLEKTIVTISHADIKEMFRKIDFTGPLNRPGWNMDKAIDRMIFECDEGMNNSLTLDEVKKCYYRCINDDTGLEPFHFFNLVSFLFKNIFFFLQRRFFCFLFAQLCFQLYAYLCTLALAELTTHIMFVLSMSSSQIQFLMYDEDLGGSCSVDEIGTLMVTRYGTAAAEEHIQEMMEFDDGDGEVTYAEYLVSMEKRPSLDFLRAKGEGLAASKCIHIDWESENGRLEAKRRQKVRQDRLQVEARFKKKQKEKKKALRDASKTN